MLRARAPGFAVRGVGAAEVAGGCVLALLFCLRLAAPVLAQSGTPQMPAARPAPGSFDFFVLSLSWSPGFCATAGSDKAADECAAGADLGFVVHGLWPQLDHGFLADCNASAPAPSRIALDKAAGLFPDEGLARYEWRKHGTCTGEAPADYFADVRRARDEIVIPAMFQSPRTVQSTAPTVVAQAFINANPGLRPGMMAVGCQKAVLQDVKFCLTKDLRGFRACPEVVRAACRSPQISVPPLR